MRAGAGVTEATGIVALALLAGPPLALLLSVVLMAAYRRSVVAQMNRRWATPGTSPAFRPQPPRVATDTAAWSADWAGQKGRTLAACLAAGFLYAASAAAVITIVDEQAQAGLFSILFGFAQLWPVLLVIAQAFLSTRRQVLAALGGYFALLLLVCIGYEPWYSPFVFFAYDQLPPTLLVLGFLWHRIRAVGPLSLAFVIGLLFGGNGAMLWLSGHVPLASRLGTAVGFSAPFVVGLVAVLGAGAAALLVLLGLRVLARLHRSGHLADQQLIADALMSTFCMFYSVHVVFAGQAVGYLGLGMLPLLVYFVTDRALRRRFTTPRAGRPPRLLFLRVFAAPAAAAQLWDALGKTWRYLGSVQLIGGPDLATSTLAPHRFLDFLGGRIGERFVQDQASLDQALAGFHEGRSRDGTFAINELYCRDDAWRTAFRTLAAGSDVVLMDLRGFSRARAGAAFELGELAMSGALSRSLLLVDASTDQGLLDETVARAASAPRQLRVSQNRVPAPALMTALLQVGSVPLEPGGEFRSNGR